MDNERFVLGVDLDGVVADFIGGLRRIAAEWTNTPVNKLAKRVTYGFKEWNIEPYGDYKDLHRFAVVERSLFETLKPMPGAAAVLRKLSKQDIRIRIITHRLYIKFFHVKAVEQTARWLEKHGIPYWDLCFMKEKADVGANLYIEDSPDNIKALKKNGNEVIIFTNSTNDTLPGLRANNWNDVEKIVIKKVKAWKSR